MMMIIMRKLEECLVSFWYTVIVVVALDADDSVEDAF